VSAAAVPEGTGKPTLMERILNGIETAGNKMPNPAILFLALCVIVILLSQALYWLDVKATYQVVEPPPVVTEEIHLAGSTEVSDVGPTEPQPASSYKLKT
jgi:aminobenzoyl-glutamate transport protein